MTTIRDVAKQCGVSAMTISAVLNNRTGKVSPETRTRVLRAIEEMGYQPNAIARGLTRRRMNTLGLVLSYEGRRSLTGDRYFSPILDGIFEASQNRHQRTLIAIEKTREETAKNLPSYLDGHCDGFVFLLPVMPAEAYQVLLKRHVPFVLVGESPAEPFLSTVDIDNVQAGVDAVRYLLSCGHRRIGLLKGNDILLSSSQREVGFRQALAEAGLFCDDRLIIPGIYSVDSGYERTKELLSRRDMPFPTALFCADDAIAMGAWQALTEQGRRVPEDVSIIGINDDKSLATDEMPLTTIRQPLHTLGERAVELVLKQIDRVSQPGEKYLASGELIVRRSVAPPASAEL